LRGQLSGLDADAVERTRLRFDADLDVDVVDRGLPRRASAGERDARGYRRGSAQVG
jgi:hypothetical protein